MFNFFKKTKADTQSTVSSFSFGEPEVAYDNLLDNLGCFFNAMNNYYEPPVDLKGLSTVRHANAHHGSAIAFKRNQLATRFVQSKQLDLKTFRKVALDFLTFGNAYLQVIKNRGGAIDTLVHVPAINIRKMKTTDDNKNTQYCYLTQSGFEEKKIIFKKMKLYTSWIMTQHNPFMVCPNGCVACNQSY